MRTANRNEALLARWSPITAALGYVPSRSCSRPWVCAWQSPELRQPLCLHWGETRSRPLRAGSAGCLLRAQDPPCTDSCTGLVALFTPYRPARFALLTATVMELAVVVFAGVVWFVPLFFQNSYCFVGVIEQ